MPPELIEILRDFPALIIGLFLSGPFFVFLGVIVTVFVNRAIEKRKIKTSDRVVAVSESEADTHQFQAIIDGFTKSLGVIEKRAEAAERKASETEEKAGKLEKRVDSLEREQYDAIEHLIRLEALVPFPPGPPPRPIWMRRHTHPPKYQEDIPEIIEELKQIDFKKDS